MTSPSPQLQQSVLELARSADLKNIRVVEFMARLMDQPPGDSPVASVSSEVRTAELPGGFLVEGAFTLEAGPESSEGGGSFLELRYRVGAVYELRAEALPPTEVLEAFAKTNGMIHLWPYFRAYVQQACAQLAIMPIVLPPFRIKPEPPTEPAKGSDPMN
jgi:hypothetical protein